MRFRPGLTLVTLVLGYAAISVGVTFFGQPLARKHFAVLNTFSFQGGPFTWAYSFSDDTVGPFTLGSSREAAISSAAECRCFWAYPRSPNEPRVPLNDVPKGSLDKYFPQSGSALISSYETSRPIQYELLFSDGRLRTVTVASSIFAGL